MALAREERRRPVAAHVAARRPVAIRQEPGERIGQLAEPRAGGGADGDRRPVGATVISGARDGIGRQLAYIVPI
jgi:hypothetical protein